MNKGEKRRRHVGINLSTAADFLNLEISSWGMAGMRMRSSGPLVALYVGAHPVTKKLLRKDKGLAGRGQKRKDKAPGLSHFLLCLPWLAHSFYSLSLNN